MLRLVHRTGPPRDTGALAHNATAALHSPQFNLLDLSPWQSACTMVTFYVTFVTLKSRQCILLLRVTSSTPVIRLFIGQPGEKVPPLQAAVEGETCNADPCFINSLFDTQQYSTLVTSAAIVERHSRSIPCD